MSKDTEKIGRYFKLLQEVHKRSGQIFSMSKLAKNCKCHPVTGKVLRDSGIVEMEEIAYNKNKYTWSREIVPNIKMAEKLYEEVNREIRSYNGSKPRVAKKEGIMQRNLNLLIDLYKEKSVEVVSSYIKKHNCAAASGMAMLSMGILDKDGSMYKWCSNQQPSKRMAESLREAINCYQKHRNFNGFKGLYHEPVKEEPEKQPTKDQESINIVVELQNQAQKLSERVEELDKEFKEDTEKYQKNMESMKGIVEDLEEQLEGKNILLKSSKERIRELECGCGENVTEVTVLWGLIRYTKVNN